MSGMLCRRIGGALCAAAVFVAALAAPSTVRAQDYPARIVTMVVPFPAGGGNDTLARIMAARLSSGLGREVLVDNRGGANGVIAMRAVARAAPDGYTLLFANSSTTSINPALYANVGYDAHKDFAPIGMFAAASIGIIVNPSFPAKTVSELIAFAKREPGKLTIGTSPPGSGSHLSAELFKARAGIDVTLVPYKGAAALTNDLLGGHIPVAFSVLPPALGNIQDGRLRVLAVTGQTRLSLLPEVPTVAESGLPDFDAVLRYGLLAPAGTPRPIVDRLNRELRTLVTADDVKTRIANEAGVPLASSPEEYAAEIVKEDELWGPLIRRLGIKVE
jgi:tripartite-type tricarboxylate transporter receptor subunit TctC